jgi:protein-tyrosine sulfotransferase
MKQIFIHGIAPRCGTNFLYRLLRLHRDCKTLEYLGEDHLLRHAHLLFEYADRVARHWNPSWLHHKERLIQSLGKGLGDFFQPEEHDGFWLTKTPNTDNIDRFFTLFPEAILLIVVRNGTDLVESGVKSFKWRYETAFRDWADSGNRIISQQKIASQNNRKLMVVKYEDLHLDPEPVIRRILDLGGIDPEGFDFEALKDLPVFGSSSYGRDGRVSWKPVEKSGDFNPMNRSESWPRRRYYRYNRICGEVATGLGYEVPYPEKGIAYWLENGRQSFLNIFRFIIDRLKPFIKKYIYNPNPQPAGH